MADNKRDSCTHSSHPICIFVLGGIEPYSPLWSEQEARPRWEVRTQQRKLVYPCMRHFANTVYTADHIQVFTFIGLYQQNQTLTSSLHTLFSLASCIVSWEPISLTAKALFIPSIHIWAFFSLGDLPQWLLWTCSASALHPSFLRARTIATLSQPPNLCKNLIYPALLRILLFLTLSPHAIPTIGFK